MQEIQVQSSPEFTCAAIKCTNNTKSKVSTFKFSEDPKVREHWLVKMKENHLNQNKNSRICAAHFTENCFKQNLGFWVLPSSPEDLTLKRMQFQLFL